jgi:hypothetical protein
VFETINDLRDYQTEFGQGTYDRADPLNTYSPRIPYAPRTQQEAYNQGTNSWGPRLGSGTFIGFDGVERPYVDAGDNWPRYFETGSSWTNTLAFSEKEYFSGNEFQIRREDHVCLEGSLFK